MQSQFPQAADSNTKSELDADSEALGQNAGSTLRKTRNSKSARNISSSFNISRDEMNLAEFPLAVLSTRVNPKVKTLEFADSQRLKTGEVIERKWLITGADKFGLPTATDDDVILGLIRLSIDQGFRERKVYFTRYELLKILRWTTEGRSYSRLNKSLDRLSGVRIRSTNAFFDNSLKAYQTCNFGIIDAYEINDARSIKPKDSQFSFSGSLNKKSVEVKEQPKSFFIWSEMIFDSFKAGYIKKLDLDLYFTLKSAVSRRLYRYLDKHFYYRTSIEKNLMNLAFEKLGLSRSYKYVSSIKQQIEPALEELIEVGFLEGFEYAGHGIDTSIKFFAARAQSGNSQSLQIVYQNKSTNGEQKTHGKDELSGQVVGEKNTIIEALVSRGITLSQAKRLLEEKNGAELKQIDGILRYYDNLVEKGDHKVSKNRIGFLYRAAESPLKFVVPPEFLESRSTASATAAPKAKRPELKVFRSSSESNPRRSVRDHNESKLHLLYEKYLEVELAKRTSQMEAERLSKIYFMVEDRLKGVKSLLPEEKFKRVLKSCVQEEIKKICGLPDFNAWQEQSITKKI